MPMKGDLKRPVPRAAIMALRVAFSTALVWGAEALSWTIAVREPAAIVTAGAAYMVLAAFNAALWTRSIRWVW